MIKKIGFNVCKDTARTYSVEMGYDSREGKINVELR